MMRVVHLMTSEIIVPEGRRPIDKEKVTQLVDSINKVGLLQPITVAYDGGRIRLVAGAHRLAAVKRLRWAEVPCVVVLGDDVQLRLAEIAENLHRNELTALDRDDLIAEWIRLIAEKVSQLETPLGGHQPATKGIRAAERELGISKADASRAVKVASLSPEAKAVATEVGLDNNRTALLEAAKETEPQKQVEAIRERAAAPISKKATAVNPIDRAWQAATKKQRREFISGHQAEILSTSQDVIRTRQGGSEPGPLEIELIKADRLESELVAAQNEAFIRQDKLERENKELIARVADLEARLRDQADRDGRAGDDDGLDIPPDLRRAAP